MVVWESGYLTQRLIRSQGGYFYEVLQKVRILFCTIICITCWFVRSLAIPALVTRFSAAETFSVTDRYQQNLVCV